MTFFAPELFIRNGVKDISFYMKAFNAVELRRFSNEKLLVLPLLIFKKIGSTRRKMLDQV
jgi:hypothetical protein